MVIAVILTAFHAGTLVAHADDWPAWRGDGTGVTANDKAPTDLSEPPNIRWKTPIPGTGHSSPIVSGDAVFLTTATDGISNASSARHRNIVAATATLAALIGFAMTFLLIRPRKQSTDSDESADRAYATRRPVHLTFVACATIAFAAGAGWVAHHLSKPDAQTLRHAICIDRQSGTIRWQTECAEGPLLGSTALTSAASATPATDGQFVYAHFGDAGTYCLDYGGLVVWANNDPVPETHYKAASSPILWNELLIVTHDTDTRSYTVALDKHTGKRRWLAERKTANDGRRARIDAYATPIIVRMGEADQLIHDSYRQLTGYDPATGRELWSYSTNAEQIVTSPVSCGDIVVFSGECNHPIHMSAIRVSPTVKKEPPQLLWQITKHVPVVCSPVIYEHRVFTVSKNGIATSRDLETGKLIWRLRLTGRYYASATIIDGYLYLTNLVGTTSILATDDEPRLVATLELNEPIYASPAVSDDALFIRGTEHLFRITQSPSR